MNKMMPFLLAAISGFLSIASWVAPLPAFLLLFAYIPLLFGEYWITNRLHFYKKSGLNVFLIGFICFFVVNIVVLWWLYILISYWVVILYFFNAVCGALVFLLFSLVKKKTGNIIGYISFIFFTVAYEYILLNIDFSFPCFLNGGLLLGTGSTLLIQWYEYTGVLGGSVWILACNVLFFFLIKNIIENKSLKVSGKLYTAAFTCLLLPLLLSVSIYHNYKEVENPVEVVIVQPNFDPYTEKFAKSADEQLDTMLFLANTKVTANTEYVIFPETALDSNIWKNNIEENYMALKIKDSFLYNYPKAKVITGIDMMEYFVVHNGVPPSKTAKKADDKVYYDFFNAAIQVDNSGKVQVYKKSKLVLGTEYVPFTQKYPQLQNWIINLGGSAQSRGRQENPSIFYSDKSSAATVICYESLFGEYVSEFVKLGAEVIFVITNDGWWDNTPAPWQHFKFSQIRAVENRRCVARCANTGISGFIDQRGNVIESTEWWTRTSLNNKINKNDKLTFYSKHGDYIGKICLLLSALLLLFYMYKFIADKKRID